MQEAKIFETSGCVVTTERLVYGSKVIPLDDIKLAIPFVDRNWGGVLSIAGMGLAAFWCGATYAGGILILIGLLLLVGAYFVLAKGTARKVLLSLKSGEDLNIEVDTTELVYNLANAINTGIEGRQQARMNAIQNELSNLPRA